jgi:hypothetical protein
MGLFNSLLVTVIEYESWVEYKLEGKSKMTGEISTRMYFVHHKSRIAYPDCYELATNPPKYGTYQSVHFLY